MPTDDTDFTDNLRGKGKNLCNPYNPEENIDAEGTGIPLLCSWQSLAAKPSEKRLGVV